MTYTYFIQTYSVIFSVRIEILIFLTAKFRTDSIATLSFMPNRSGKFQIFICSPFNVSQQMTFHYQKHLQIRGKGGPVFLIYQYSTIKIPLEPADCLENATDRKPSFLSERK